jgi:hypothetical protein
MYHILCLLGTRVHLCARIVSSLLSPGLGALRRRRCAQFCHVYCAQRPICLYVLKINGSLSLVNVYALSSRLSLGCAQLSFTGRKSTNCSCLQILHSRMSSTQHFARVIAGQNNVLDRSMGIAYPRSSQNAASGSFHTSTSGMQTPNPMFSCLDVAAVFA